LPGAVSIVLRITPASQPCRAKYSTPVQRYNPKTYGKGSAATRRQNRAGNRRAQTVVLTAITGDARRRKSTADKARIATAGATTMAEPTHSTSGVDDAQPSIERAKMILTELACAAQTAALSVVDEQKSRAAVQVGGVAEAVRAAARSLERSQSPVAAGYVDSAAHQIEVFADAIRERNWAQLAADVEEMARRRPAAFVAGAVALGFLAGRFLSAAARSAERSPRAAARATESAVAAAVSSAAGNGELANWPPPEARELP
jgi:hypothetical protein